MATKAETERLADAQFVGEDEYQGIATYHFALPAPASTDAASTLEGDFQVAQDGDHVLYSHWLESSRQGDFTQDFDERYQFQSIHEAVAAWGRELDIPTDDLLLTTFRGEDHQQLWVPWDGHPNAEAHRRIAEFLVSRVLEQVADGRPVP